MGTIQVKPWGEGQGDYVLIEESDFNSDFHELLGDASSGGDGKAKLTAAEIKAKLTAANIDFKGNASRESLQALLDDHEAAVVAVKTSLTEKGIEFAEDADLVALQALLDAAV
ncbi:hypothetical protein [Pseudomonas fluorescens]|uniref:HeH/LEM domain-containing protein n=1 Tax=Pseudomonas fluorescens TaxID=294 RepID=A0A5E7V897_PSEFL|nr:hypothetical protein [Pseudomonas fluorescens]VVQ19951.1 hypothetical protein PS941_04899 [Pseudomonas fluorescens]